MPGRRGVHPGLTCRAERQTGPAHDLPLKNSGDQWLLTVRQRGTEHQVCALQRLVRYVAVSHCQGLLANRAVGGSSPPVGSSPRVLLGSLRVAGRALITCRAPPAWPARCRPTSAGTAAPRCAPPTSSTR